MAEGQGKKAAASKADQDQSSKHNVGLPAGHADAGVGTGVEAPEDTKVRGQQRMHIGAGHVAAPIEPPDGSHQPAPAEGHSRSSTNPVSAATGVRTYTGENHVSLVGEDGK